MNEPAIKTMIVGAELRVTNASKADSLIEE